MKINIDVIIPSYKVRQHILDVIERTLKQDVRNIIIVDDACPESTGELIKQHYCNNSKIKLLVHKENKGVGGAVLSGYKYAFNNDADIAVKIDGDGQMDPEFIPTITRSLINLKSDYAKGNRFFYPQDLATMPGVRIFGNAILSFVNKLSSGYWSVMDPTNGYTAIHKLAYAKLSIDHIAEDYFFESDMLYQLGIIDAVVLDVPMAACYASEKSNLSIKRVIIEFPSKYLTRFIKRVLFKYFIRDFNIASIEIVFGAVTFISGIIFGLYQWYVHLAIGEITPAGTVMIVGILIILGFQLLLSALNYDISHEPSVPLCQRDKI